MSDITNISPGAMNAVRNLLREHRSEFREDFENIVNRISKGMGGGGHSHGYGVRNTGGDLKAQRDEVQHLINALKRGNKALSAYEQYMLSAARKHRQALNDQIDQMKAAEKAQSQNTEAVADNTDAHRDQSQRIKDATTRTKDFVRGLAEGKLYLDGLNKAVNELKTSYKLGFKWDPIKDAFEGAMMGMDPQAMMEFQAQFRRTSGAMETGIDGFNKVVAQNQFEMMKYTGSLQAAAQAMGNMYELSHNMGLNIDDVSGSANMLFNEFKRMQSVTSITVDQFVEMNQRMLANTDIQSKLLRLNQSQRAQYIQGLNQQQLYLQMMGLQKEVAEQLIAATENMSGKKGLDRLQDKAKTKIFLQSGLGWDAASADRFATLKGKTNKDDVEAAEFQKMVLQVSEQIEKRKTMGLDLDGVTKQGEIFIDSLVENLGQQDVLDAGRAGALQQSAKTTEGALAKQQQELQQRDSDNIQIMGQRLVQISDILQAWSGTAAAVLAGAVALTILNSGAVSKAMEKVFEKILGGSAAGAAGGAAGAGGRGAPGAGGKLGRFFKFSPKGLGAGAILGAGGALLAEQLLDPDEAKPENRAAVSRWQGGLSGAAAGAGMGMVLGPWGALAGAAIGGIAGAWSNWNDYQTDANSKLEETMNMSNQIAAAQKTKMEAEKQAIQLQIDSIIQSGKLTEEQKKTVEALSTRISGINANLKVADVKQAVAGNGIASRYLSEFSKQKHDLSDTASFGNTADQLEFMMQTGGIKGSAREMLMQNITAAMGAGGAKTADFMDLQKVSAAIKNGEDVDIPVSLRKYFETGMANTTTQLQQQLGANMGSIVHEQSAQSLSDTLTSQRGDYNDAKYEVSKLQTELEELKKNPFNTMDRTGNGRAMIAKKEQELEDAKERLKHAADTARTLMTAANEDGSLAVAFTDSNMKTFARELGIAMKKTKKNDTGIKAGGLTT